MADPEVVLDGLNKVYPGGQAAVSSLSLTVARGEIVALIGPSGCGKSTTLRLVAGLDEPNGGSISIAGKSMRGVAPQDRDVAMVFQGYALYPHMTAREIMNFPLKMRNISKPDRDSAVDEAAAMLGLTKLLDRRPDQLSGGERQRVAMGRAIVRKPRVFLFDEPLSNIDPALREDIRIEIGTLVRKLGATALYVTHDHIEAMTLADRVAVLQSGELLQCAPPQDIYMSPAAEFVGTFVGSPRMNVFDASYESGEIHFGSFRLKLDLPSFPREIRVGIRPEHIVLRSDGEPGQVLEVEPHGAETIVSVRVGDLTLRVRLPGFDTRARGDRVGVSVDPSHLHFFTRDARGTRLSPR